jgi:hypothetical protein
VQIKDQSALRRRLPGPRFAPGPMAHRNASGGAAGGFRTDVTFTVGGEPAAVAGFAAVFIDPDHPDIGPSSLRVYDRRRLESRGS